MSTNTPAITDEPRRDPSHPESSSSEQDATNARIVGASGLLALGNIASRVLGLVREVVLSFLFGATAAVEAFQVAILVPKMTYDLLIGGHVNGAIVPVLGEIVTLKGRQELWRVVSILVSLALTLLTGLVLLMQLFAPQIVALIAGGLDASTQSLTVEMLRLVTPALIFLGLFAILSGALYALQLFTWPAFAGMMFNGAIVIFMLLLTPPVQRLIVPGFEIPFMMPITFDRPPDAIRAAAFGWLMGAVAQMLLQMPGLRGSSLRLTLNWRHPALRQIAALYAPVMFSLVMDVLVIRLFSYRLASEAAFEGGIAYMNYATTLIQFPQGLVATAISIAILPTLAAQSALLTPESLRAFKDTLGLGLRLATTLIIPAAVGLFVLAGPIIVLLLEHGAFDAQDTATTMLALRLYLIGLPFAAIDLLLVYAFYARKDTVTPALVGLLSHSIYMIVVLLLFDTFDLFSLMIADSVKHIVHAGVSAVLLRGRLKGLGRQRLILTGVKATVAALVMGAAGLLLLPLALDLIGTGSLLREAVLVIVTGGACVVVYLAMAALLRLDEFYWIAALVRRRIWR